jgi:hypothetical protein
MGHEEHFEAGWVAIGALALKRTRQPLMRAQASAHS